MHVDGSQHTFPSPPPKGEAGRCDDWESLGYGKLLPPTEASSRGRPVVEPARTPNPDLQIDILPFCPARSAAMKAHLAEQTPRGGQANVAGGG